MWYELKSIVKVSYTKRRTSKFFDVRLTELTQNHFFRRQWFNVELNVPRPPSKTFTRFNRWRISAPLLSAVTLISNKNIITNICGVYGRETLRKKQRYRPKRWQQSSKERLIFEYGSRKFPKQFKSLCVYTRRYIFERRFGRGNRMGLSGPGKVSVNLRGAPHPRYPVRLWGKR